MRLLSLTVVAVISLGYSSSFTVAENSKFADQSGSPSSFKCAGSFGKFGSNLDEDVDPTTRLMALIDFLIHENLMTSDELKALSESKTPFNILNDGRFPKHFSGGRDNFVEAFEALIRYPEIRWEKIAQYAAEVLGKSQTHNTTQDAVKNETKHSLFRQLATIPAVGSKTLSLRTTGIIETPEGLVLLEYSPFEIALAQMDRTTSGKWVLRNHTRKELANERYGLPKPHPIEMKLFHTGILAKIHTTNGDDAAGGAWLSRSDRTGNYEIREVKMDWAANPYRITTIPIENGSLSFQFWTSKFPNLQLIVDQTTKRDFGAFRRIFQNPFKTSEIDKSTFSLNHGDNADDPLIVQLDQNTVASFVTATGSSEIQANYYKRLNDGLFSKTSDFKIDTGEVVEFRPVHFQARGQNWLAYLSKANDIVVVDLSTNQVFAKLPILQPVVSPPTIHQSKDGTVYMFASGVDDAYVYQLFDPATMVSP